MTDTMISAITYGLQSATLILLLVFLFIIITVLLASPVGKLLKRRRKQDTTGLCDDEDCHWYGIPHGHGAEGEFVDARPEEWGGTENPTAAPQWPPIASDGKPHFTFDDPEDEP